MNRVIFGLIGLELIACQSGKQAQAVGIKVISDAVTQFSYDIQDGVLVVTVLSDDEHTNHDPAEFLLYVDVTGG